MATTTEKASYWSSWAMFAFSPVIALRYLIKGDWQIETLGFYAILCAYGARHLYDLHRARRKQKLQNGEEPTAT
jgi:hypothetical protein